MSARDLDAEPAGSVARFSSRVVEAGWLLALATVPLYFDVYSSRVFEPDKTTFLRCLVLLMLLAQLIGWVSTDRISGAEQQPGFRRWANGNPLLIPIVALVAVEFLATATSIAPSISFFGSYQRLQGTYTTLTYLGLFFLVVANLRRPDQWRRFWRVALLTSLPISLYGLVQHFQLDPLPWGGDVVFRVTSTMGNAIFLGAYLVMIIPLTAARLASSLSRLQSKAIESTGRDGRLVLQWVGVIVGQNFILGSLLVVGSAAQSAWWAMPGVIGIFILLCLAPESARNSRLVVQCETIALTTLLCLQIIVVFLTQSRGPWLGMAAGLVVFVILLELRHGASRRLLNITVGLILVGTALLVVFNLNSSPLARFRDVPYVGRLGQLGEVNDGTGRVRVLIWQGTLDLLLHHPTIGFVPDPIGAARLIVGYGPEAMHLAYNVVYPPALGDLESRNASPDRNHNDLLDYVVTAGLLGLASYLFLLVVAFRLALAGFRTSRSFASGALVAGLIGAVVSHLVETQTGIAIVSSQLYFWFTLALFVVVWRQPSSLEFSLVGRRDHIAPVAGGAPTSGRHRKGARPSNGPPGRHAIPPAAAAIRPEIVSVGRLAVGNWRPIGGYAVVVAVVVTLAIAAASATVIGAPVMMYLTFLTLAGAMVTFAVTGERATEPNYHKSAVFWVGILGGALVAIALGLNLNGIAADVYQKQGTALDSQQHYADSTEAFAKALEIAPTQDYYALFLGRAYLELATIATAQPQPVSPSQPPTYQTLFSTSPTVAGKMSRVEAMTVAEVALNVARDLEPLDPDHYANLGRLYRLWGETVDRSKLDLAAKNVQLAITLSPHSVQLYDEWAVTSMAQGNLNDAQAQAMTAVRLDPSFAAPHLILGDVYLAQKQIDLAFAEHVRALRLDPNALSDGSFEQRVSTYVAAGKGQALADEYAALVKTNPTRPGRLSYAFILAQDGQNEASIDQFRLVAEADPSDWLAARNLAIAYAKVGDRANAILAATRALRAAPSGQQAEIQSLIDSMGP